MVVKFVPEKHYFEHIRDFAFREELCQKCRDNEGKNIRTLLEEGNYKAIARNMLSAKGLNYGQLPKGLLLFHNYEDGPRTPMEEHLVELPFMLRRTMKHIHFTVSHDHLELFKAKLPKKQPSTKRCSTSSMSSHSERKPSPIRLLPTLTEPVPTGRRSLLFRPGYAAQSSKTSTKLPPAFNFIKNIDNVVPDHEGCHCRI